MTVTLVTLSGILLADRVLCRICCCGDVDLGDAEVSLTKAM